MNGRDQPVASRSDNAAADGPHAIAAAEDVSFGGEEGHDVYISLDSEWTDDRSHGVSVVENRDANELIIGENTEGAAADTPGAHIAQGDNRSGNDIDEARQMFDEPSPFASNATANENWLSGEESIRGNGDNSARYGQVPVASPVVNLENGEAVVFQQRGDNVVPAQSQNGDDGGMQGDVFVDNSMNDYAGDRIEDYPAYHGEIQEDEPVQQEEEELVVFQRRRNVGAPAQRNNSDNDQLERDEVDDGGNMHPGDHIQAYPDYRREVQEPVQHEEEELVVFQRRRNVGAPIQRNNGDGDQLERDEVEDGGNMHPGDHMQAYPDYRREVQEPVQQEDNLIVLQRRRIVDRPAQSHNGDIRSMEEDEVVDDRVDINPNGDMQDYPDYPDNPGELQQEGPVQEGEQRNMDLPSGIYESDYEMMSYYAGLDHPDPISALGEQEFQDMWTSSVAPEQLRISVINIGSVCYLERRQRALHRSRHDNNPAIGADEDLHADQDSYEQIPIRSYKYIKTLHPRGLEIFVRQVCVGTSSNKKQDGDLRGVRLTVSEWKFTVDDLDNAIACALYRLAFLRYLAEYFFLRYTSKAIYSETSVRDIFSSKWDVYERYYEIIKEGFEYLEQIYQAIPADGMRIMDAPDIRQFVGNVWKGFGNLAGAFVVNRRGQLRDLFWSLVEQHRKGQERVPNRVSSIHSYRTYTYNFYLIYASKNIKCLSRRSAVMMLSQLMRMLPSFHTDIFHRRRVGVRDNQARGQPVSPFDFANLIR